MLSLILKCCSGESDVNPTDKGMEPQRGGAYYACAFKAMVADWRVQMAQNLPFIFVQLVCAFFPGCS